jgi:tyrosine-protein kinase Etk/Wzc
MPQRESGTEYSLGDLLSTLKRRRRYIIVPTALFLAGAVAFAVSTPSRYRARVLLAAEPAVAPSHVRGETDLELSQIQEQLRAVRESLLSRPLLEQLVTEFDLHPGQKGAISDQAAEDVRSRISVQVEGDYHFYLGFDGNSKEQATAVANRLGELFINRASALRERRAREESLFLEDQLERVRKDLVAQDQRIRDYKGKTIGLLPDGRESGVAAFETLQAQEQLGGSRIAEEEAKKASLLAEIRALEEQGVTELNEPMDLRAKRGALNALSSRYKKGHPDVVRLEKEIAALEERDSSNIGGMVDDLSPLYARYTQLQAEYKGTELRLASYLREQEATRSRLREYQRQLDAAPEHEREIAKLTHDYEVLQTQYQTLLDRQQEANLSTRLEELYKGLVFSVIEPARPPAGPHSPHRARLILMGLAAGLGLGTLLAFGREHVDTSFFEPEDVQTATGLPVLAEIPSIPEGKVRDGKLRLPNGPSSLAAEQYRFLGVRVRELMGQGPWTLGVASAVGGEGKTTTAANLAIELASILDGKVLLVDCDLRRPRLQKLFGLSPQFGLSELLSRTDENVIKCISKVESGKIFLGASRASRLDTLANRGRRDAKPLYVLPAGAPRSDSLRLLQSRWADTVFARLRAEFDYVILDLPPMIPIADGRVLAQLANGIVLVVRSRRTRREFLHRALQGFDTRRLLGVVLNDVDFKLSRCEYAYRYYDSHDQAAS